MSVNGIISHIVLTIFLSGCANVSNRPNSIPIMVFNPSILDLGKVKKGDSLQLVVGVRNIGNDTLRIFDIGADCGCTDPEIKNKSILPGDSSVLRIKFNSKNIGERGDISRSIVIRNNSKDEFKILKIKAQLLN